jgi:hypothetical protein
VTHARTAYLKSHLPSTAKARTQPVCPFSTTFSCISVEGGSHTTMLFEAFPQNTCSYTLQSQTCPCPKSGHLSIVTKKRCCSQTTAAPLALYGIITCCRASNGIASEAGAAPSTAREKIGAPDGVRVTTCSTPCAVATPSAFPSCTTFQPQSSPIAIPTHTSSSGVKI